MRHVILLLTCICLLVSCEIWQSPETQEAAINTVEQGVEAVSTFLPPPWNLIATGVGGLAIGLLRAWQKQRVAKAIIKRVELAKNGGTVVDFSSPTAKAVMATVKSGGADKLVDQIQGGKTTLPF